MSHHGVLDALQGQEGLSAENGFDSDGSAPRRYRRHSTPAYVWGETNNEDACFDDMLLPDYWSAEDQQQVSRMAASSRRSSTSSYKSGYEEPNIGTSLLRMVGSFGTSVSHYLADVAGALTSDASGEFIKGAGSALSLQADTASVNGSHWLGVASSTDVGRKKSQ